MLDEILMSQSYYRKGKNLIGHKFGLGSIVVAFLYVKDRDSVWLVQCRCGTEYIASSKYITGKTYNKIACEDCSKRTGILKRSILRKIPIENTISPGGMKIIKRLKVVKKQHILLVECPQCKELFESQYSAVFNTKRPQKKCFECSYKIDRSGPNNNRWNPSITNEERIHRRDTVNDDLFVKTVLKRDNYKCIVCNINSKYLAAHHLNGYHWYIEGRYDPDNGVTLCNKCHTNFHKKYGYGNNTKQQFEEFRCLVN